MDMPLLPLPEVVLFPNSFIPLHIFEHRYKELIDDLLNLPEDQRLFIVATMTKASTSDKADNSKFYPLGTVARLVHHQPFEDGRSNIMAMGEFTVKIKEVSSKKIITPYRQASVQERKEVWNFDDEESENSKLLDALVAYGDNHRYEIPDLTDRPLRELLPQLCFGLPLPLKTKFELLDKNVMSKRLELLKKILMEKPVYLNYKPKTLDTRKTN